MSKQEEKRKYQLSTLHKKLTGNKYKAKRRKGDWERRNESQRKCEGRGGRKEEKGRSESGREEGGEEVTEASWKKRS